MRWYEMHEMAENETKQNKMIQKYETKPKNKTKIKKNGKKGTETE